MEASLDMMEEAAQAAKDVIQKRWVEEASEDGKGAKVSHIVIHAIVDGGDKDPFLYTACMYPEISKLSQTELRMLIGSLKRTEATYQEHDTTESEAH